MKARWGAPCTCWGQEFMIEPDTSPGETVNVYATHGVRVALCENVETARFLRDKLNALTTAELIRFCAWCRAEDGRHAHARAGRDDQVTP